MTKINNVILFPTLRISLEELEQETYELIEDQSYEKALENIDELLSHQYASFDIHVNKLHCLTKLGRLQEAEEYSEQLLMDEEDEHYYDYLGYYIMILYEQNNFNTLMSTILEEEKKRKIPPPFERKFRDIYRLCYQMNTMKANDILNDFETAVNEGNHQHQWYFIQQWIQLNVEPTEVIINALKEHKIHPVIKTKLLKVFRDREIDAEITVEKFGQETTIQPRAISKIEEQPIYLEALDELSYIEQENPTLYNLIKQLLYQYHYVSYPFLQEETDVQQIVDALIHVGKKNLSIERELKAELFEEVQLIEVCSQLYLDLIYE